MSNANTVPLASASRFSVADAGEPPVNEQDKPREFVGAAGSRHISPGAGRSDSMSNAPRPSPHPAVTHLLDRIGSAPDIPQTMAAAGLTTQVLGDDEWLRLPGLFRRWDLEQVVDADHDFHVEPAGHCEDGTQLFAVYARATERSDQR